MRTAESLMNACIRNGVHYLNIAVELNSYARAEKLSKEAKRAGVILLLGCGGSVALLGCLVSRGVSRVADPVSIDIALHVARSIFQGSATSTAEKLTAECFQRRNGQLQAQDIKNTGKFDSCDGRGEVVGFPVMLLIW